MDELDISGQFDLPRQRQRRISRNESVEQRLARFVKLQNASFELLRSSSEGYQNFLRRNHKSRRVEVVDGVWRPVSVDCRKFASLASLRKMKAATGRAKDQLDLENLPEGE